MTIHRSLGGEDSRDGVRRLPCESIDLDLHRRPGDVVPNGLRPARRGCGRLQGTDQRSAEQRRQEPTDMLIPRLTIEHPHGAGVVAASRLATGS